METGLIKSKNLQLESASIIKALSSCKVYESDELSISKCLMTSVKLAYDITGFKCTQENMDSIVSLLPGEIISNCPFVRIDEIPIAVKKGCYGEFGEFMGINVATIVKFVKGYYNSEKRAKIILENKPSEQEKTPASKEQIKAEEDDIIRKSFEKFLDSGFYNDMGNHIYNKLDERGIINLSNERKNRIMDRAMESLKSKNNPNLAISKEEKRKLDKEIVKILSGTPEAKSMIIREAKQLALMEFFNDLAELGEHINYLLCDRKKEDC